MFRHHRLVFLLAGATALLIGLAAWGAALAANLIPDASFESRLPLWFEPPQSGVMYAARTWHPQAHSGTHVLRLSAWMPKRMVMTPPLTVKGAAVSVAFWARHEGGEKAPGLEVSLFDQAGNKQVAKVLTVDVQATWTQHKAENVAGLVEGPPFRLCFSPSGGERGSAVLIDDVGLFQGAAVEAVAQNEEVLFLEAEDLVRDQPSESWERVEHFGAWYNGYPSGRAMISGYKSSKAADRSVRAARGDVKGGRYTLWVRLHAGMYEGKFTVQLQQGDRVAAEREFTEKGRQGPKGSNYFWDWDTLEADLAPGPVTLALDRPAIGASWVTRKIDCFVLTKRAGYKPDERDFLPRALLRFKRADDGVAPYFAHCFIRRHQGPDWYYNPGVLCRAGLTRNYAPPPEPNWLGPGDASPWVDITDALKMAGRRNNFSILFSRRNHVESNLPDPIRGTLEIATGWDEPKVLRTVKIDQPTPRVWLSLPGDFSQVERIRLPEDFIAEKKKLLTGLPAAHGKIAAHVSTCTGFALNSELDDPKTVEAEIEILRLLGFNRPYFVPLKQGIMDFYRAHGWKPSFDLFIGTAYSTVRDCPFEPDKKKIEEQVARAAETYAEIRDKVEAVKMADEPGAPGLDHMAQCGLCRERLRNAMRAKGFTPADLGVKSWDEVVPVPFADAEKKPRLYFHSARHRLQAMAAKLKVGCDTIQASFPRARCFVNYTNAVLAGATFVSLGTDFFDIQRSGGCTMGWTENWLGWSAGPQMTSYLLAVLRAACKDQPLGMYVIGAGEKPNQMRMKFVQTIAGGARTVNLYNYGPHYCSIDSWAEKFDLYPVIRDVLYELGTYDALLDGAKRRPGQVALLYNVFSPK